MKRPPVMNSTVRQARRVVRGGNVPVFDIAAVVSTAVFIKLENAERPTPNIQRRMQRWPAGIRSSVFDVRCSMFSSSLVFEPFFPATLEHENIFQLRFSAQFSRDFATRVTALAAAVNDDLFFRRPSCQKLRKQFVPTVFIQ